MSIDKHGRYHCEVCGVFACYRLCVGSGERKSWCKKHLPQKYAWRFKRFVEFPEGGKHLYKLVRAMNRD